MEKIYPQMITQQELQGIIALAIQNNKPGFIQAMNANGYRVDAGIADEDLLARAWEVYTDKGREGILAVLNRVSVIKSTVDLRVKDAVNAKFAPADQRGFGEWFNNTVTWFGDVIGGNSVSTGPVTNVISTSALSPFMLGIVIVVGGSFIVIFRKSLAAVIGISFVVFGVVMYGIFAKSITSTTQGGNTVSHGGLGSIISSAFGFFK
jgi:hypothetical protein